MRYVLYVIIISASKGFFSNVAEKVVVMCGDTTSSVTAFIDCRLQVYIPEGSVILD